ncbi:hypothetical protein CUC44_02590 [Aeromonas lusitana]|uniref:Uncharacterized protein n=1 Tax=Aeromonas lusitana TaxID=931529 RepID=A0A2M8HE44_9GAMM|nr:hypothetical protein CUC44_02590 [Aeromonas lusitana]
MKLIWWLGDGKLRDHQAMMQETPQQKGVVIMAVGTVVTVEIVIRALALGYPEIVVCPRLFVMPDMD